MYKEVLEQLFNTKLKRHGENMIHCIFHDDETPSLGVNTEKGTYNCFTCHAKGNVKTLAKQQGYWFDETNMQLIPLDDMPKKKNTIKPQQTKIASTPKKTIETAYTLDEYCKSKRLDKKFLQDTFKMHNGKGITIPYYDIDGKHLFNKYRMANKRMFYDKGIILQPYGLWLLNDLKRHDELWIVEGESDTQTLWQNGIPALGMPGASSPQPEWFDYIEPFKDIYIVFESDDGGNTFISKLFEILNDLHPDKLPSVYIVTPKDLGKKDINELWCVKPDKKFFVSKKIDVLKVCKTPLIVAYQQIVNGRKYLNPENRVIAVSLMQKLNATYRSDVLYDWNEKKQQYDIVKRKDDWYSRLLATNSILQSTRAKEIRTMLDSFISNKPQLKAVKSDWIHFKNTSVNYKTLETRNFGSDYFVLSRLPFNYNPNARSFVIDKMFEDWVDNPIWLWELIGYTLIRAYPRNKFFILFGRGDNGKTTFINILKDFLGSGQTDDPDGNINVANVSLEQMLNDRFSVAQLYGKLLNAAGEMKYNRLVDTKVLKDLTGEERIMAQHKFGQLFSFTSYAKLVFATNKVPATNDKTDGFYRRIIVINFKKIPSEKLNPLIRDSITAQDMEYIGYKAILSLQNLHKKGFMFDIEKEKDMRKEYEMISNPVKLYLDNECEVTRRETDYIRTTELIDNLRRWLNQTKQAPMQIKEIYEEMSELGFNKTRIRVRNGQQATVYQGIKYKNNDDEYAEVDSSSDDVDEILF